MKSNLLNITIVLAILGVGLSFESCKKKGCMDEAAINYDAEAEKDDESCEYEPEPEITFEISSPAEHTTFMLGDTVHIASMFETTGEVHGYEIKIVNTSNSDEVVFTATDHTHESPVHIHAMWVNDVAMHSDMMLEIKVNTDHDGGSEVKSIGFHCMPMM